TDLCDTADSYARTGLPRARIRPPCAWMTSGARTPYLARASGSDTERYVAIQYPFAMNHLVSFAVPNARRPRRAAMRSDERLRCTRMLAVTPSHWLHGLDEPGDPHELDGRAHTVETRHPLDQLIRKERFRGVFGIPDVEVRGLASCGVEREGL